jgi:hypothetical protein
MTARTTPLPRVSGRRGAVYIAPSASFPADGRMVDPDSARFWISWQDDEADEAIEDDEVLGAQAAIAWGCERSDVVVIRLGHRGDTYFSAGAVHPESEDEEERMPMWPPEEPPPEGWYAPDERVQND